MRTGRPRSFDRDAALDAAITVFWEHGYDATSISMLTEALGIGRPSIYAAFGDKETLFIEALDRYMSTYAAFIERALSEEGGARDEGAGARDEEAGVRGEGAGVRGEEAGARDEKPDAREAVRSLLYEAAASYTRSDRPQGCLLISAATNCSPESSHIAAHLRERRAAGLHALEERLAGGVRAGELPEETDAHAVAVFYSAVLQGMSAQARDGASRRELEQIAEAGLRAWFTF